MLWFTIGLAILSSITYHLLQKVVPHDLNPVAALLAAYVTSTLLCAGLLLAGVGGRAPLPFARLFSWPIVCLGVAIVGIELGYLLAYRAGWALSTASITANVTVALVLLPVGLILYAEPFTVGRGAGVALCVSGLWLISR